MKSKLAIFGSYFVAFIFIFFVAKGNFIVAVAGLMMATLMLSSVMASLSYGLSKGKKNDSLFYFLLTFLINCAVAIAGILIDLKDDVQGLDRVAMIVFMALICAISSGGGYYFFDRIFRYKAEKNK